MQGTLVYTRQSASATAMDSSASHRLALIEGSQLQERPDSTNDMFLYTHMLCPYAQTALLTLLHLVRLSESTAPSCQKTFLAQQRALQGVPHQVVHIDLSIKPAWFTQLCRDEGFCATVPVIDFGGKAQTESIDICR